MPKKCIVLPSSTRWQVQPDWMYQASPNIVTACVERVDKAVRLALELNVAIPARPFITVSVGMSGDHHVREAIIDPDSCISCKLCLKACPKDAISDDFVVIEKACIGYGHCQSIYPPKANAVSFRHF